MLRRTFAFSLPAALFAAPAINALAQPATPGDLDVTIDDHLAWVLSLFDGGADDLDAAAVEARFHGSFLDLVSPEEFIVTVRQLAGQLGPLELVERQPGMDGELAGTFRSESDGVVMIAFAVDPATGLITGFFITPAQLPEAATPAASPAPPPGVAGPVVEDSAAQVAIYREMVDEVRAVGEPAVVAVLAGDDEALASMALPDVAAALRASQLAEVMASYTERQLQMVFAEVGAYLFGQWNDDTITGVMVQGGASFPFELKADAAQDGALPVGRWRGEIPAAGLALEVSFATDAAGELTAALSIPAQRIRAVPLADVAYLPERPVGEMTGERAVAPGGTNTSYTIDFAWGDHLLRIIVGVDVDSGRVSSLQVHPAIPVPPAIDVPEAEARYRLPFEGTWWVFWGGETELDNYHAAVSSQRYACDLVIWKDGASFTGDGTRNEDYWAWGQPVLAPAGGNVVHVVNDAPDLPPGPPTGGAGEPGGNHIVIRTAENEFVIVAHMRQGSVQVREGDEVTAGQPIGLVGNSGNTSEPHIHIHVQDSPNLLDVSATGIPLRFDAAWVNGARERDVLPVQGSFVAPYPDLFATPSG